MGSILLALGIALIIPAAAFNFRWFNTEFRTQHWSGWACTGCASASVFCVVLGNLIR